MVFIFPNEIFPTFFNFENWVWILKIFLKIRSQIKNLASKSRVYKLKKKKNHKGYPREYLNFCCFYTIIFTQFLKHLVKKCEAYF